MLSRLPVGLEEVGQSPCVFPRMPQGRHRGTHSGAGAGYALLFLRPFIPENTRQTPTLVS